MCARADFALRCAYAHGTAAIRSHVDQIEPRDAASWEAMRALREDWRGRLSLRGSRRTPRPALRAGRRTRAKLRSGHDMAVLVGHACALAAKPRDRMRRAADLAARAGLDIAALPICNRYLMDRRAGETPRLRGIAPVHELRDGGPADLILTEARSFSVLFARPRMKRRARRSSTRIATRWRKAA